MCITGRDILEACGGELLQGNPEVKIDGFSIDTRTLKPGQFFVPLPGENTDGHRHVPDALAAGAGGCFHGPRPLPPLPEHALVIGVPDPLRALQLTAAAYRKRFTLPVVAVTGSSGKTTTKDLIAGVLAPEMTVLKTTGNLNNEIGLPLTLLELREKHQAAVFEMGMSAPGEIAFLADLARPTVGVITVIGEAHLEQLGSMEAIARAKEELLVYLGESGTAVLNGDDPRVKEMGKRFPGRVFYYGLESGDFRATELSYQGEISSFRVRFPDGQEYPFSLALPGKHMVGNALAAVAVGYLLGVPPSRAAAGLQSCELTGGRLQFRRAPRGFTVIDDSYNANPGSVGASLEVLAQLGGIRAVAVLGDMLELGPEAPALHRETGRRAARSGIAALITVGNLARETAAGAATEGLEAHAFPDHAAAAQKVLEYNPGPGWYVLVKGSRGMKMERIVAALLE